MTHERLAQLAMFGAAACYAVGAVAYVLDGKPWVAATLGCYVTACITLWMAG